MADPKVDMAEDLRADLEKQISDLKREMSRMSKSLAARASDALEDAGDAASDALEDSRGRARRIGRQRGEKGNIALVNIYRGRWVVKVTLHCALGIVHGQGAATVYGKGHRGWPASLTRFMPVGMKLGRNHNMQRGNQIVAVTGSFKPGVQVFCLRLGA